MRVYVKLSDTTRFSAYAADMPKAVRAALTAKSQLLGARLKAYTIQSKLSGQVLNKKTGKVQRSLKIKMEQSAHKVVTTLYTNYNVAKMYEKGGRIPAHIITPRKAKILAWSKDGIMNYAHEVHHPGVDVKARHFMADSLREMSAEISTELKMAVLDAARKA